MVHYVNVSKVSVAGLFSNECLIKTYNAGILTYANLLSDFLSRHVTIRPQQFNRDSEQTHKSSLIKNKAIFLDSSACSGLGHPIGLLVAGAEKSNNPVEAFN